MSMIYWMLDVTSTQVAALRATPALAADLAEVAQTDADNDSRAQARSQMAAAQREVAEARERELMEQMKEFNAHTEQARARIAALGPFRRALCLGKSWHILHYLFTGHVDAASAPGDTLATGEELGEDVGGYGPARLHTATEAEQFAKFLDTLTLATLQQRISYQELSRLGIYGVPGGAGTVAEFEDDMRGEIAVYFPNLQRYVSEAALAQDGLLAWLS